MRTYKVCFVCFVLLVLVYGTPSKPLSGIHESAFVLSELRCAVNHHMKERRALSYYSVPGTRYVPVATDQPVRRTIQQYS